MRYATFDCYGTLIDWNGGVGDQLARIFGDEERERLLGRYHEIEPEVQREEPSMSYRDVMAETLKRLAKEEKKRLKKDERDALGESLPSWRAFPEVRGALEEALDRGWRLVILSNTDREFIEASIKTIGVPFERAIVASEIGSYKPAHGHWERFYEETGADRAMHVHVAASLFHDIKSARGLGIPSVWINRLGEQPDPPPTREKRDLNGLADTLDELVPPAE